MGSVKLVTYPEDPEAVKQWKKKLCIKILLRKHAIYSML